MGNKCGGCGSDDGKLVSMACDHKICNKCIKQNCDFSLPYTFLKCKQCPELTLLNKQLGVVKVNYEEELAKMPSKVKATPDVFKGNVLEYYQWVKDQRAKELANLEKQTKANIE